jgi:Tol biopolymer transport system component
MRVAAAGGKPVPETDLAPGELGHYWPSFLPDGRHYLLLVESEKGSPDIQVATLGKTERERVTAAESEAAYAAPGYLLFVRERALTAQRFDPKSLRLRGEPIPIAEHVGRMGGAGPTRYAPFSTSNNGVLAHGVAAVVSSQIGWFDRQGKSLGTVGSAGDYADPELSPDGKRLAVCRDDPRTGTPDIWIMDTSRGTFSRLTFHPRWEVYPVWSPDASRLAFSWDREGNDEIYLKPAGGGVEELLWKDPRPSHPLDWSSDSRFLICVVTDPRTRSDLWMLPFEGSRTPKPLLQTPFNESEARLSPDGRFLAYTSDESGRPEVMSSPSRPCPTNGRSHRKAGPRPDGAGTARSSSISPRTEN